MRRYADETDEEYRRRTIRKGIFDVVIGLLVFSASVTAIYMILR